MRTIRNAKTRPAGFTLIELSIVILIIGILLAFVLAASAAGLEQARVRATQALISKISAGLEDRVEALLSTSVNPNGAHRFLASISVNNPPFSGAQVTAKPWGLPSEQRAQVLARLDQLKAELPDCFFIDPTFNTAANQYYPINFCGLPYPGNATALGNYILPLGNSNPSTYVPETFDAAGNALNTGIGAGVGGTGTGIRGASYAAATSLYKLMGYTPRGCDGVDNGNNAGDPFQWVDDYGEGTTNPDGSPNAEATEKVTRFLANHQHKTARSEILYAVLVEGLGPFGSVFSREDFREGEIKDTDNDGVPEFVDGWGEPIQFFRWPVWHRSGGEPQSSGSAVNRPVLQKGDSLYGGFETRQQNALDPNGQLVSLAWWSNDGSSNPAVPSGKCVNVQNYFGPLFDPTPAAGTGWDRSGATARRAYFTKFLVLSGGPDRQVGVPMLTDDQIRSNTALVTTQAILGSVSYSTSNGFSNSIPGENWAMLLDPNYYPPWYAPVTGEDVSLDDLTNQNTQNQAGGFQ